MATPENYRRRARQCVALADWAADEAFRNTYLDLAKRWRDLADRIERGEFVEQIAGSPKQHQKSGKQHG